MTSLLASLMYATTAIQIDEFCKVVTVRHLNFPSDAEAFVVWEWLSAVQSRMLNSNHIFVTFTHT